MWELDHKKGWAPKNWCFWTVVLEKTLESPLDSKEIKPVNPKGNQPWIFIGRTDAEAKTPILWPPDVKNWLIWKDPDAGKDWRREEKGTTEDEMLDGIADPMDRSLRRPWELVMDREAWRAAVHGVSKNRTQLSDRTTTSEDLLKRNILCLPTSYFNSLYFLSSSQILLNFLVCGVSYGLAYQEIKSKQSSPAGGWVSQGLQKLLLCQEDLTSILNSSQNSSVTKSWNGTWRLSVWEKLFVYFMLWFPALCRPRDSLQRLPGCLGDWIQEYAERLSYLISSGMSVMTARLSKCANSFKKKICFSKDSVLWLTPYWPQLWPNMLPKVSDTLLPQLL